MAANPRLRVFADANILIRGMTFPRYPYEILRLATEGAITLVVSESVLADARYYMARLFPEHLPRLQAFLVTARVVIAADPAPDQVWANTHLVRDVKDVPIALAAASANVDYLVSTDADLTDTDESTVALRDFLHPAQVLRPGQFLNEVMGWSHETLAAISRRTWDQV
jgi:predicted nucleic acid-binding protein